MENNRNYIDQKTIVELMAQQDQAEYRLICGKQIMYDASLPTGERKIICIHKAVYQPSINGYWVDATEVQIKLYDEYDIAIVLFRMEGKKVGDVNWRELKPLLTQEARQHSVREGYHWKMYIKGSRLEVKKGDSKLINVISL